MLNKWLELDTDERTARMAAVRAGYTSLADETAAPAERVATREAGALHGQRRAFGCGRRGRPAASGECAGPPAAIKARWPSRRYPSCVADQVSRNDTARSLQSTRSCGRKGVLCRMPMSAELRCGWHAPKRPSATGDNWPAAGGHERLLRRCETRKAEAERRAALGRSDGQQWVGSCRPLLVEADATPLCQYDLLHLPLRNQ